jgi:hypothetical protein
MRKLFALLAFVAVAAYAEASFQQVEGFIEQKNYQSAEMALEGIIANHPNSAKAFYAMSQAQAGLGNLEKAQFALNKAKALDPELKFASSSNIESLQQAITPQTAKIEVVEESHFARNMMLFIFALAMAFVIYYFFIRKPDEADDEYRASTGKVPPKSPPPAPEDKVTAVNSQPLNTATTYQGTSTPHTFNSPAPAPTSGHTTVVNNYGSNNDGFVTGMLVGEMMTSRPHETVIVEQPVYVERQTYTPVPSYTAPARDTSWDNDSSSSSSSRSSSWDSDDSSSKSSSSWSSSSSSDSSWSSSSDSSSSWDSGSSSSDSGSSDW